jgi:replicative DNA helicase
VNAWLRELGIYGQRSADKRIPAAAFRLPTDQIALLLRHLWATDGTMWLGGPSGPSGKRGTRICFTTAGDLLARDVMSLLLRLGIVARLATVIERGTSVRYDVTVSGRADQLRFLDTVGSFGPCESAAQRIHAYLTTRSANTNVDTLPPETWNRVRDRMRERGVTQRDVAAMRGTSYGGTSHFRFVPSRPTVAGYALLLDDPDLAAAAENDLFWDSVVSIDPDGEEEVFDLTVPGPACWLADGIVSHNSGAIEQDADVVMFIYRDEVYNKDGDGEDAFESNEGKAELIVGKHRNGPIDTIDLHWQGQFARFMSAERRDYGVNEG